MRGRGVAARSGLAGLVLLPLLWLALMSGAGPAAAAEGEQITSYDVVLSVRSDGALAVTETIDYDFGRNEKHGIFRDIATTVPYDNDQDRRYELRDVSVTSPTPATPTQVSRSESAGVTSLRIGDPDRTVSGQHTYVVHYVVDGALNAFSDHVELFWNAIGEQWAVPITEASVVVSTPGPIQQQTCFAGPKGSTLPCTSATTNGNRATFVQPAGLQPFEAFTVVVGLRKGDVSATGPILEQRWSLRRSLTPTPLTGGLGLGVLALGGGGVMWLLGTQGRDRRFAGQTPGVLPASGQQLTEEPVPMLHRDPVAVAFAPPEGLRPGQLGTLLDEQANVIDVTATIVDLAVRGHLRIEELERAHWFSSRDWRLDKLTGGTGELLPFEKLLYDGLFTSSDQVLLSSLKKTFAARLAKVQTSLYEDVMRAGWFRHRPDQVRNGWRIVGLALAVGGGWLTWLLSHRLHWAPIGVAVSVVGLVLLAIGRRMPARTPAGSAVLAQAKGFREYIRTAEAEQLRFEEGQDIFSRYLPYAIVFGEAERWVRVFGSLAAVGSAGAVGDGGPGWYVGPAGWDAGHFSDSLTGFTANVSSTMAAASASSSGGSGFSGGSSGGGGGGGGGGSW